MLGQYYFINFLSFFQFQPLALWKTNIQYQREKREREREGGASMCVCVRVCVCVCKNGFKVKSANLIFELIGDVTFVLD